MAIFFAPRPTRLVCITGLVYIAYLGYRRVSGVVADEALDRQDVETFRATPLEFMKPLEQHQ